MKKGNREGSIIATPDNVRIEITAGRRLQFIRHVLRSELSHLQKTVMTVLIDRTNEGYGSDLSLHGLAYPSLETLAADVGASHRGVINALKELLALGQIKKVGAGNKGGRDKVNRYWLPGWNTFGSLSENSALSARFESSETVHSVPKTVHSVPETVHSIPENSALSAPDSSHIPSPKTQPSNTLPVVLACGEREPAIGLVGEAKDQEQGSSLNQPDEESHPDYQPGGRWYEMDHNPLGDLNLRNEYSELFVIWPGYDQPDNLTRYVEMRRSGARFSEICDAACELAGIIPLQDFLAGRWEDFRSWLTHDSLGDSDDDNLPEAANDNRQLNKASGDIYWDDNPPF